MTAAGGSAGVVQQLTEPGLQQIASALSKDIPGPEWESLLRQEREHLGEAFGVAFLYGIFGAGSHTLIEGANASALRKVFSDRQGLELAGIGAREAGSISQMALTDPVAAARLHQEIWKATPIEQRAANSRASIDRLQLAEAARAGIPGIEPQPDGTFTVHYHDEGQRVRDFASREEAAAAIIAHEQDRGVELARANASLIQQLQSGAEGTGRNLAVDELPSKNLAEWAGDSAGKIAQARARVAIMLRQAGKDMGLARDVDLSTIPIMGMRWNAREPDGSTTLHIALAEDSQPHHVIEEHAEGLAAWLLDEGHVSEQTLTRWLRDTEAGTRSRFLHDDLGALSPALRRQELLEAFSHVAVNNATGRYADSALPSPVRTFFRAFKEMIAQHLRIATDFLRLRREGKVDPHFAHWLDVAGGLDPDVHGPLRPEDGSTAKAVDTDRAKDEAFSFSLAESTPERDARPITPLRISSEALPGAGQKDWRNTIRAYIATQLQGKMILNVDSGHWIKFTSESKGKAASRLHTEKAFRSAHQLQDITVQALHLGSIAPDARKAETTAAIHYYAMPIEIEGKELVAWFNTREPKSHEHAIFYEFGIVDKNAARKDQSVTTATKGVPITSQFGPQANVRSFLDNVKDWLPAAIKVGQEADGGPHQETSFSIENPGAGAPHPPSGGGPQDSSLDRSRDPEDKLNRGDATNEASTDPNPSTSAPSGDEKSFNWWFHGPVQRGIFAVLSDQGTLDFGIVAGKDSPVRGTAMFKAMMTHYGERVERIGGNWYSGTNLDKLNELTASGITLEESAAKTWTGGQAAKYGFTKVRILEADGKPGDYSVVRVVFER
ncbi:hypothetical protein [Luteolibacter sp. LG18]|uniref:LPD3 domain-containing protein n=1 Tax=Luteolibacter sp. LG18 TaxID=2819286 RepID=UPI002B2DE0B9|nr:hypothetical protein llg_26620 [Luteolibacter sp. LG18]